LQTVNIFEKVVVRQLKNIHPCIMNLQVNYSTGKVGVEQALLSLLIIVNPYKPGRQ
jgi:hypothetical protein